MVTTTETQQVNINVSFERNKATWLALGGTGALLTAAVLMAVTMGVGWATYDVSTSGNVNGQPFGSSTTVTYGLFEGEAGGSSTKYTSSQFDEADGIGLVRAGGPLAVVAVVLGFVGTLVLAASVFVQGFRLRLIGNITAGLFVLFLLLTLVLFPIGLADMHEAGTQNAGGATFSASELSWGAGLIVAIIGGVAAIAGTALGLASMRNPN